MTMSEFLLTLKSNPLNASSPTLLVADAYLTDAQKRQVTASAYGGNPYAVVVHRTLSNPRRTHDGNALMFGAIDVSLYHPATGVLVPDGDALSALQAAVRGAERVVDEVRSGYALGGKMMLASETPVIRDPESDTGGLFAATRFTYPLWR